jgi:hypothetical protein
VATLVVGVDKPWRFSGQLDARRLSVERFGALPPLATLRGRASGRVDLTVSVHGSLDPLQAAAKGTVIAESLAFDDHLIDRARIDYDLKPESLALSAIDASLYEGRLTGDAFIPFFPDADASATAEWTDINAGRLLNELVRPPAMLRGSMSGKARLRIPGGNLNRPTGWEVRADVSLPSLSAGDVRVASVVAKLDQRNGRLTYDASGRLFGGLLELSGTRQQAAADTILGALGSFRLTLDGAELATAGQVVLSPATGPSPVAGPFHVDLASEADGESRSWRGEIRTGGVSLEGEDLASGIQARIEGFDRGLRLAQLSGALAGGQLRGSGEWNFEPRPSRALRIGVRGADAAELAALVGGPAPLDGPLDIELRLYPGEVWRIAGTAAAGRVEIYDLQIRNVRLPIDNQWHPRSGGIELRLSGSQLAIAGGRMTGRLTAQRTTGWSLNGSYRFYRVDVARLQPGQSSYGKGRLTGTLTISGRNVRSINDVRATLLANLEDTPSANMPILNQIRNVVPGAAATRASTFDTGRLEARLARGIIQLDRLSLANGQLQVYLTGAITLAGRLRLEATVATGQGANPLLAEALLSRLLAVPTAPTALLLRANDFLSSRVVHLAIVGTLNRPIIRLRPLPILREEVVRFLREATGGIIRGRPAITRPQCPAGLTCANRRPRRLRLRFKEPQRFASIALRKGAESARAYQS